MTKLTIQDHDRIAEMPLVEHAFPSTDAAWSHLTGLVRDQVDDGAAVGLAVVGGELVLTVTDPEQEPQRYSVLFEETDAQAAA